MRPKRKNNWYDKYYEYICLECNNSVSRRATSSTNGSARKCPECGSHNILREDHPLLKMGKVKNV
jgi:putative FmdB family regulatory protein